MQLKMQFSIYGVSADISCFSIKPVSVIYNCDAHILYCN